MKTVKTTPFQVILATALLMTGTTTVQARTYEVEAARHFKIECNGLKKIFGACRKTIKLPQKTFVAGLEIKAKGREENSSIEVRVNGDYKGEVNAPAYGAQSHLPVNAWTDSIEVSVEKGGDVVITSLEVESNNEVRQGHEMEIGEGLEVAQGFNRGYGKHHVRNHRLDLDDSNYPLFDQDDFNGNSSVTGIAYQTQQVVFQLKQLASFNVLQTYIAPIQVAAAKLVAVSQTHFPSEAVTRESIVTLSDAITQAAPFLSEQLETDVGQGLASQLMAIKAQLDNFAR